MSFPSAPLSPLLGTAATLAVIANLNFQGIPVDSAVLPAAIAGLGVAFLSGFRSAWREWVVVALVFSIPCMHLVWIPILRGADLALVDAGDFWTYASLGSWLMHHPITEPARLGADYNSLQFSLLDYQNQHHRLGALFLLAFFAVLGGYELAEAFTLFSAVLIGLLSLAVYVFARAAFPRLPGWMAALVGIFYGMSPLPVWAAYAAFLPQTLGLALVVAAVGILIRGVRQGHLTPASYRDLTTGAATVLPLSLLLFAAWSVYPEGVPVGAALCGLYLVFKGVLSRRANWKGLILTSCLTIALSILISPQNFIWGIQGMSVQLNAIAHSLQQLSTPLNLIGTMVLAARAPLTPEIVMNIQPVFDGAGYVMLALGLAGLVSAALLGDRAVILSALATAALLMAAVAFKYRFSRYGWYPHWTHLYTWNLYKAAQFASPFVGTLALGGILTAVSRMKPRVVMIGCACLIALVPLNVYLGHDWHLWRRLYLKSIDPELIAFLQRIPPDGRLLLSLNPRMGFEGHDRYVIYSILGERSFLSTVDAQSPALFEEGRSRERESFLTVPISYVIEEGESRFSHLPVLDSYAPYRLRDAKGAELPFTLQDRNGAVISLTNKPDGLAITP